ncbi:hypothetical protein RvY_17678 [Ramazzottius varieornatus]|uniref:T-complex protein 11-like protein 1 n=1 Tax=Ramazzottius varieornatus TaxID=947166 RepID=A0A1D1W6R8_RAMVA|nr:hypothetical protein RvY_17678 [Ramazzottius varieornatus]
MNPREIQDQIIAAEQNKRPVPSSSPIRINSGGRSSPGIHLLSPRRSPLPMTPDQLENFLVGEDRLQKMILAHEIAVNDQFKIEDSSSMQGTLEAHVKGTIEQAFWDVLQSSLSKEPPDYTHALILLEEVKETLISFLPDGPRGKQFKESIRDNLDVKHVQQQVANDAFDFREKADFIIVMMGKLCAPARDDEIKRLREIDDIVPLFREVFKVLEEMKVDMLNFTLSQIRPVIYQHSVEYEQQMFDEYLQTQQEPLAMTQEWLKHTALQLLPSSDFSTEPPAGTSDWKVSPTRILKTAFLDLFDTDMTEFPETITVDLPRLLPLLAEASSLVLQAAVLAVTWNTVGNLLAEQPAVKSQLTEEVSVLMGDSVTEEVDLLRRVGEVVLARLKASLPAEVPMHERVLSSLTSQIIDLQRPDNPVRKLIAKRLKEFVEAVLSNMATKVPTALLPVQKQVVRVAGTFAKIFARNQTVFGKYYSQILSALGDELGLKVARPSNNLSPTTAPTE